MRTLIPRAAALAAAVAAVKGCHAQRKDDF
jgi:hypothetical protein